jgi:glycosyltransferase involved in cell wall biosynthesis
LLFTANDPTALASELMRLIDDARLREAIGRRALLTVEERFGMSRVARHYIQLYEELMLAYRIQVSMAGGRGA